MRLDRVQIYNFRSIKQLTFDFDPSLKILVGKNESGKSNIIKALSFLSDDFNPTIEDKRELLPDETIGDGTNYCIWFVFKLNEEEVSDIYESLFDDLLITRETDVVKGAILEQDLFSYCQGRTEGLYVIDLNTCKKSYNYWALNGMKKILPNIKRHKNYAKRSPNEELTIFNSFLVDIKGKGLNKEDFVEVKMQELHDFVGIKIAQKIKENRPDTIFWQHKEENLLPNKINISTFASDPKTCIPLKILFNLAGIKDIKSAITTAQLTSANQFDNLLKRVSFQATAHFSEVWKEYPDISFSFTHNGDNIIASIQEKNKYALNQRSDGFKRFINFLILISACVKNEELENTLLLFDEPDVSLHPSGVRYLRDELKKIASKNLIVVSTHSIFMIDQDFIERHLIVAKNDEVTDIKKPTGQDYFEEEVLFKAVGYSLFEVLKQKNIIFEGWRDKKLYKTALESTASAHTKLCRSLSKHGYCQSNGVKGIKTLTPIFETANRKCLIITDSDEPAKQRKDEYEKLNGIGLWKSYSDLDDTCTAITGEDFLKPEYIESKVLELQAFFDLKGNPDFTNKQKGVIENVNLWLSNQKGKDEIKPIISKFKSFLFDNLKCDDIDDAYFTFLKKLEKEINLL